MVKTWGNRPNLLTFLYEAIVAREFRLERNFGRDSKFPEKLFTQVHINVGLGYKPRVVGDRQSSFQTEKARQIQKIPAKYRQGN